MGSTEISLSTGTTRTFNIADRHWDAKSSFAPNSIYTTKYNLLTFIPKFALEQFRKTSNCLFLVTSSLQQIEGLAPTNRYATSIGLCFVLSVSAVKEIWEDWRRSEADVRANCSVTRMISLEDKQVHKVTWAEVQVGDVIEVRRDEEAPADLLILSSSEYGGLCFVETSNIDGETNLKIRSSLFKDTKNVYEVIESIRSARIECEQPNSRIDGFEGVLTMKNGDKVSACKDHILIRGARLRNTNALIGVVVYTGSETKIMMNTNDRDPKITRMESIYNQQTVLLFLLLLCAILYNFSVDRWYELNVIPNHDYIILNVDWSQWMDMLYRFLVFCLLYHNFIPINLNITVEAVRLLLGHGISSDEEFVATTDDDELEQELNEFQQPPELPTVCRTSTLVEELGQIRFVFSDKTGTLTRNQMRLKHLAFCHNSHLDLEQALPEDSADASIFFKMLATCHTVVVDERGKFQASSPDEAAIVKGIFKCPGGWQFVNRDLHYVYIKGPNNATEKFQLLNVLEFNSERRRMSVIVKDESNVIWLYTKGADGVLFDRSTSYDYDDSIKSTLDEFGREGMRTLCFAYKQMEEAEYLTWLARYDDARNSLSDRGKLVEQVCDEIECGWRVVGVSAVEDRLQDRVLETISMLREAGMSVWILTGDRKETALNVGYSCGLIDSSTFVHNIEGGGGGGMMSIDNNNNNHHQTKYCIVIEGSHSETILAVPEARQRLLTMALSAEAVICCRTSPQQKAAIVKAVKEAERGVTLAIGDGANDVSMIRAAHVGVGLCGREGVQAARSADFALRKFCHLQRLLLVHGCYSYQRLSKVFLYCLYKNLMLYAAQFWYSWKCGFSGQSLYDGWFLSLYNIIFACVPIIILGVTEQYVQPGKLLVYPGLYRTGPAGRFFNPRSYWATTLNSIFQSLVIINVVLWAHGQGVIGSDNQAAGLWSMGATVFAVSVVTVNLKIFIIANYWTWLLISISCAGPASWFLYTFAADYISLLARRPMLIGGISRPLFKSFAFWGIMLLVPVVCLSRDFLWKFYKRSYTPLGYHIVQELEEIERKSLAKSKMESEKEKGRPSKDQSTIHGFAFSQTEGQDKILSLARPFLPDPFKLLIPNSINWSP